MFTKSVHSYKVRILQNMSEVPVQDLFESASHEVTPTRHNLRVHAQSKCVQIQGIVIKCESQELLNVFQQHRKIYECAKFVKHNAPKTFLKMFKSRMFVCATHQPWKWAHNFFINLTSRNLPKCVWTSRQTASLLDTLIMKLHPELFLQNLQAENF